MHIGCVGSVEGTGHPWALIDIDDHDLRLSVAVFGC